MNADSVRPLVSSLFFSSSSASSSPLLPLSPLFSLSGFDPLTHQHAMATRHTRHGSVRMSKVHVMAFWGDQYVLYWISPMDAPRRELSAGILHATRTADARTPCNFRGIAVAACKAPRSCLRRTGHASHDSQRQNDRAILAGTREKRDGSAIIIVSGYNTCRKPHR